MSRGSSVKEHPKAWQSATRGGPHVAQCSSALKYDEIGSAREREGDGRRERKRDQGDSSLFVRRRDRERSSIAGA